MLPPFIIDQIRKREEEERVRDERPVLEIPQPAHDDPRWQKKKVDEDAERGVFIIDLMG